MLRKRGLIPLIGVQCKFESVSCYRFRIFLGSHGIFKLEGQPNMLCSIFLETFLLTMGKTFGLGPTNLLAPQSKVHT
jgi:hypothetical protein